MSGSLIRCVSSKKFYVFDYFYNCPMNIEEPKVCQC